MPYSRLDFAAQLKQKYPDYADWDDDYLVDEITKKYPEYAEWVEPKAPVAEPPGMLRRGWDFATKPIISHIAEAQGLPPDMMLQAATAAAGAGKALPPGLASLGAQTSILDVASMPSIASHAGGFIGKVGKASGLLDKAAAAGVGTEGLLQLQKAAESGDWSEVPGGLIRMVLGGIGLLPGGKHVPADELPPKTLTSTTMGAAAEAAPPPSALPMEWGPGAGTQTAGRAPVVQPAPPLAPRTGTTLAPSEPGVNLSWQPSPGSATTGAMPPIRPEPISPVPAATMAPASDPNLVIEAANKMMDEKSITRATSRSLAKLLGIDPKTAHETLESMAQLGILNREGVDTYRKVPFKDIPVPTAGGGAKKPPVPKAGAEAPPPPLGAATQPRLAGDDLQRAALEAEEAVTKIPEDLAHQLGVLPPPAEGTVRLYRGEGPLSEKGSNWYTTEPAEAGSYAAGGGMKYTDVPAERLDQLNTSMGRDPSMRGEFQLPEGYVAQAKDIPGARSGEAGFFSLDLLKETYKTVNRGVGDFLRASVAGDIPTAIRNVLSGLRMVGEAMIENPLAAIHQRMLASRAMARGQTAVAQGMNRAAKLFTETAKAFPRATFEEGAASLADALSTLSGGAWSPKWGNPQAFAERLKLMENVGDAKLAKKLSEFSSAQLTGSSSWRRALMFFNIMGDRFINRTYLKAHVDALQKVLGANSPAALEALAARNPAMKNVMEDFLTHAGSEAFRAAWQNPAAGHSTKELIRVLDETPAGLVIQPFAKAFFSNMLPNIAEKVPFLAQASKRVQNSHTFYANKALIESLQGQARGNPAIQKQISALKKANREFADAGIYHPSKILARQTMGAFLMTSAIGARLMKGDDGTEFDQMPVEVGPDGKATKVSSFTSQAGEDLPFWLLGDMIGHKILSQQNGTPYKYEGPQGKASLEQLWKGLYGSRYGIGNPAFDLIGAVVEGKKSFSTEFLDRTARSIAEDIGRMAGSGSWLLGSARRATAMRNPEEATIRRADVTEAQGPLARVKESFLEGAQSQIPRNPFGVPDRTELPPSIHWASLKHGKTVDPAAPLVGGTLREAQGLMERGKPVAAIAALLPGSSRFEIGELEKFANANPGLTDLSQILPRRSQEPAYDELVLQELSKRLEKKALPLLKSGRLSRMSRESQVAWFESLAHEREAAKEVAAREFRKLTGHLPQALEQEREKKKSERLKKRTMREELRSLE